MLAFENNCFCFQVTSFFTKKVKLFKMFIKRALYLTKRPITGKQKQLSSKANFFFSKFEFDTWFHFFKKTRKYQKIGFPPKPDDVIVMSSNVHEWKGKPRSIV